jgi:peptidoglycan-associated lipoprotein
MRVRSGLYFILPTLIFAGCASQQSIDAQTAARQQMDDAQTAARSQLEGRIAKLEADYAAQTARLNQLGPSSTELKNQMDGLRSQVASQQTALSTLSGKVDSQETSLTQVKETANDAVKIARDSRMVSGKIIDSQLLTEDMVLYNYEQPELTAKGKAALDELIKRAVPQLPYIFIEIIGYSDDMSLSSQNRRIALERAESVRRYLFEVGAIPLHRMSVISYGDLKPLTSDGSLEGRSRNRRVTVQVLK